MIVEVFTGARYIFYPFKSKKIARNRLIFLNKHSNLRLMWCSKELKTDLFF
jgi:hypothetical protein